MLLLSLRFLSYRGPEKVSAAVSFITAGSELEPHDKFNLSRVISILSKGSKG